MEVPSAVKIGVIAMVSVAVYFGVRMYTGYPIRGPDIGAYVVWTLGFGLPLYAVLVAARGSGPIFCVFLSCAVPLGILIGEWGYFSLVTSPALDLEPQMINIAITKPFIFHSDRAVEFAGLGVVAYVIGRLYRIVSSESRNHQPS